jgi:hypothetical protein
MHKHCTKVVRWAQLDRRWRSSYGHGWELMSILANSVFSWPSMTTTSIFVRPLRAYFRAYPLLKPDWLPWTCGRIGTRFAIETQRVCRSPSFVIPAKPFNAPPYRQEPRSGDIFQSEIIVEYPLIANSRVFNEFNCDLLLCVNLDRPDRPSHFASVEIGPHRIGFAGVVGQGQITRLMSYEWYCERGSYETGWW